MGFGERGCREGRYAACGPGRGRAASAGLANRFAVSDKQSRKANRGVLMWFRTGFVVAAAAILSGPATATGGAPRLAPQHCVVEVVGVLSTGELLMGPERCHATLAEAVADSTNGAVLLPSSAGAEALADDRLAAAVSTFTLGIHFDGPSGSGSSISVVGSDCSGGYWNTGSAWANRISSSWNGCARLRHWDGPGKTGAYEDTRGSGTTDTLTALDNRAESVSYHAG